MSNIARAFAAAIAVCAAMVIPPVAATAAAHHDDMSPRKWVKYRDFDSHYMCEMTGAGGAFIGRWEDWHCDDDNTLWVDK